MTPICLVTGFLGTGKTTLLKRIVAENRDRRIVYLVNEFSPLDIDGALVSAENPDVISIPGGSIFCRCLVTEFIGRMREINERPGTVDGVVIEASGTADPAVIADMLAETGLGNDYELSQVLCVVDPRSFLRLIHTLPNIIRQTEAADLVLLNKCDVHDAAAISETETELRRINPTVRIERCVRCEADIDLFSAPAAPRDLHGDYAKCRDPHFAAFSIVPADPVDPDALKQFIEANAKSIYRVKGHIETADGLVYLDYSESGIRLEPAAQSDPPPSPGLSWICRGETDATRVRQAANAALSR